MEEVLMLRTYCFAIVIVCLLGPAAAQVAAEELLPAGTILRCTLDEPNFSSRTAEVGDPVLCHVGTLAALGRSVVPHGADLAGYFQEYRDPGRLVGKGWLELTFDRLVLPGAVTLPLSAKVTSAPRLKVDREGKIHGRGHPKRDAIGWAVPLLWPVKVVTLPARGPRPALKGEVRITLRLLEDVEVPTIGVVSGLSPALSGSSRLRPSSMDVSSPRLRRGNSTTGSAASTTPRVAAVHEPTHIISVDFGDHDPQPLIFLIRKDGGGYLTREYWVEAGQLHLLTSDGGHKLFPLSMLDLEKTVRFNRERDVEFVLRTLDASQP
jgi:hypothetical protein